MSTMIGLSPRQILERRILYKHGRTPSCVFSGSMPRPKTGSTVYKDYSQYKNDGTINGATWTKASAGLWALSFNGTNDYVAKASPVGIPNDPLTVMAWINPTTLEGKNRCIIQLGFHGFTLGWTDTDDKFRVTDSFQAETLLADSAYTTLNKWILTSATHSGTNTAIQTNGVVAGSTAADAADYTPDTDLTLWIGDEHNGVGVSGNAQFAGQIAFVRVFNRAMPTEEIAGIFRTERRLFGV